MGEITLHRQGAVAILTICAPEVKNALTASMAAQLAEICDEVDADDGLGAAILRGEGATFCSGVDTRIVGRDSDPLSITGYADASAVYGAAARVSEMKVPTIAAVRGAAVGAGLNLAMATSLRVVSNDARLVAGFMRLGLHPGGGYFAAMSRLAGTEAQRPWESVAKN